MNKVILSWPSLIQLAAATAGSASRSWIQLARTGSFVSNRYGKFSITREDLTTMLSNFNDITPKAPTELPIDYDHLSMDPKKPGDGMAAGWMKKLELRGDGEELWAEVEWTPDGAARIAKKEYRFVSPSFVKDHTHKDGKKIGTTLLAAAITNHPFLEGMKALTLYNFSAMGDVALNTDAALEVVNLAEIGQRVMIAPGNARTQDEIGGTFEITEVVGEGDDCFVTLKDANGVPHKWFRATELLPASATPANPIQPNLVPAPDAAAGDIAAPHPDIATATAAVANKPATPAEPAKPSVPGDPAEAGKAASAAAQADANDPNKPAEAAAPDAPKPGDAVADAAGANEKKVASGEKTPQNVGAGNDVEALIKQKVAAALAGAHPKGTANMMFKLRNDKNEEIEVTAEQLAAAGINVVPEGATAIPTAELDTMKGTITNLSSRLDTMAADTVKAQKAARVIELNTELTRLSSAGLITKATRDKLFELYQDASDLAPFRSLASTFTTPVVTLNTEHGSGGKAEVTETPKGEDATKKIIALANTIAKERGISLRDATIAAGAQLGPESEAYRDQFMPTVGA